MRQILLALLVGLSFGRSTAGDPAQRSPTFDDRVAAQKAIEEVYWNQRSWPKENPGPKPPLSTVMPDATIRAKVDNYLKQSNALQRWWHRPITGEQLQAEMDRMARETRDARVLGELYAALGNDSHVIAETLARQMLVDRLIRNWYANDSRFHADVRATAEAAVASCASVGCLRSIGGAYHETTLRLRDKEETDLSLNRRDGVIDLDPEDFDRERERLATTFGSSNSTLPLRQISGLEETDESYRVVAVLSQKPDTIATATVVWPKKPFDVWWSVNSQRESSPVDDVGVGVWMPTLVGSGCTNDSWSRTFTVQSFPFPSAIWTGTEMIIWPIGRYFPATDSWLGFTNGTNAPDARGANVWTGKKMIVWGGSGISGDVNTGASYDPTTDTWTRISSGSNVPSPRHANSAVWTGTQMIVWGGYASSSHPATALNTGGRYDPLVDSWTATSTGTNVPTPREFHTAVWTGTEMIVWGGSPNGVSPLNTGGRYNPSTDDWLPTSTGTAAPSARLSHTAVWTGTEMIVWGGSFNSGGRYNPTTDTWQATSTGLNVPNARMNNTVVWTGTEMIVWGGSFGSSGWVNTGGRYRPDTDTWSTTSMGANVPTARSSHAAVWTGTEMIIWGGRANGDFNTGGRYDPASDTWVPTNATANVPTLRDFHTAVWTGAEMIVWGGLSYNGSWINVNTGGRYSPATDTWAPTTTGTNCPSPRGLHTAIWTGRDMVV